MIFFKRTLRKPLLPLLFLAVTMAGTAFLAVNSRSIQANMASIDELYNRVSITCEVMPDSLSNGALSFSPFFAADFITLDEVASYYGVLKSPFYFAGAAEDFPRTVYGTNDLDAFAADMFIEYTLGDGYAEIDFSSDEPVCLMEAALAEELGYRTGDTISVMGGDRESRYSPDAPAQQLTVIGTFQSIGGQVAGESILVPESRFFSKDMDRLIYNDWTRRLWYKYVTFRFTVKPEYNREFDQVEEMLKERLKPLGDCSLYVGTRELKHALRPLERKMQLQQRLDTLLRVAFVVLPAVICYLIAAQERAELLIRRLYGERRRRVFLGTWLPLCLLLLLLTLPSAIPAVLLGGEALLRTQLPAVFLVSALAAVLGLAALCGQGLIPLYQSMNSD